jgi:NTP pyrophosphatase (non-canonical NTP hydrolase)
MFNEILREFEKNITNVDISKLIYYFERHIELDEYEHGPMALEMVSHLAGNDSKKWDEIEKISIKPYKKLFNKMKINATEQTSTFPCPVNKLKGQLRDNLGFTWRTEFGQFEINEQTILWIMSNVKTSMFNDNRSYIYNKAFYEAFYNPTHNPDVKCNKKPLKMFNLIRDWADQRGLYEKGDVKTQLVKLQEEMGELAKATLEHDKPEIIDAIGDMVVVLTNLAHLNNVNIETCISEAYNVISKRKGKMINGTFVKDEN